MKYLVGIFFVVVFFTSCTNQQPHTQVIISSVSSIDTINTKTQDIEVEFQEKTIKLANKENIAIVYAIHDIGKYSIEAINTANTYLTSKKSAYNFFVYDIEDETKSNFDTVIDTLQKENINKVIFLITEKYINDLLSNEQINYMDLYFPIINIKGIENKNLIKENMVFGGIDYEKQFEYIFMETKNKPKKIYEIYDNKPISKILHKKMKNINQEYQSIYIEKDNPNYTRLFRRYKDIKNSIVVLNTSIIKSAILLSQLRANEMKPKEIYSTQVNYTSLIFLLTQQKDRKDFKIVNMISNLPKHITTYYDVIGHDIRYNWVNYATLIGLKYLFEKEDTIFGNQIIDNQVQYNLNLVQVNKTNFTSGN